MRNARLARNSAMLQSSSRQPDSRFDEHDMTPWVSQHISVLVSAAAALVVLAGLVVWWVLAHRKSAEEIERQRRAYIVRIGRIIDGTVLDWTEQPDTGDLQTLHYRYAIGGVTYQSAQDLSSLKDVVKIDASCLGMPASVRYDPKNPANSIIVAETWSGLHHLTTSQESPEH